MQVNKRIISILLVVATLLSFVIPKASAAEVAQDDVKKVGIFSSYGLFEVHIVADKHNKVFIKAEDLAAVMGGEYQIAAKNKKWSKIIAGTDKVLSFQIDKNVWHTYDNNDKLFGALDLIQDADISDRPIVIGNDIYVPLLESVMYLGGTPTIGPIKLDFNFDGEYDIVSKNLLKIYTPKTTYQQLYTMTNTMMKKWGAMEVSSWRGKDDSLFEKSFETLVVFTDGLIDVVQEGKLIEAATFTYDNTHIKDALRTAMSFEAPYTYEEVSKQWKDFDTWMGAATDEEFWNGILDVVANDVLDSELIQYYDAYKGTLAQDGLGHSIKGIGIMLNNLITVSRMAEISKEQFIRLENIFVNGEEFVGDKETTKCAKQLLELNDNKFTSEELFKNTMTALGNIPMAIVSERVFEALAKSGISVVSPASKYCSALLKESALFSVGVWVIEKAAGYEFGSTIALDSHYKTQQIIRSAMHRANASDIDIKEKAQYIYDCAMFYCQLKESSYKVLTANTSLMDSTTVPGQMFDELTSVWVKDMHLAEYDEIKEICNLTDYMVYKLFYINDEWTSSENNASDQDNQVSTESVDIGKVEDVLDLQLALLGINENEWGSVRGAYVCDCDDDDEMELIVEVAASDDFDYSSRERAFVTIDSTTNATHVFKGNDNVGGNVEVVKDISTNRIYLRCFSMIQDFYEIKYYEWTGEKWEMCSYYCKEHYSLEDNEYVPTDILVDGESVNEQKWNEFESHMRNMGVETTESNDYRDIMPSSVYIGIENAELRSYYVSGDGDEILEKYAEIISSREDFVCSATGDIGLGGESTVFILRDTANKYFNKVDVDQGSYLANIRLNIESSPLRWIDYAVVATKDQDGVHFHTTTFHFDPNGWNISNIEIKDNKLHNNDGSFSSSFVCENTDGVVDFKPLGFGGNESSDLRSILNNNYWTCDAFENNGYWNVTITFGPDVAYIQGDNISCIAPMQVVDNGDQGAVNIWFNFYSCEPVELDENAYMPFYYTGSALDFGGIQLVPHPKGY